MIWLREINKALINHIKTLTKNITNYEGELLNIGVIFRNPNIDLEKESYPKISIDFLNTSETSYMKDVNTVDTLSKDEVNVVVKSKPTKYNFKYQISVWTKKATERDIITGEWVRNTPKFTYLYVTDPTDNTSYPCMLISKGMTMNETVNSVGETVFRSIFSCDIIVSVDNSPQRVYPVIRDITIQKKKEEEI